MLCSFFGGIGMVLEFELFGNAFSVSCYFQPAVEVTEDPDASLFVFSLLNCDISLWIVNSCMVCIYFLLGLWVFSPFS
jgi:hypothetical protein